jgi:hypothetical protein
MKKKLERWAFSERTSRVVIMKTQSIPRKSRNKQASVEIKFSD